LGLPVIADVQYNSITVTSDGWVVSLLCATAVSLCLCGGQSIIRTHHRDTENTEVAKSYIQALHWDRGRPARERFAASVSD